MAPVALSLGTNLGDRLLNMQIMERRLEAVLGPPVVKSRLMETEPVGTNGNQPWFFNRLISGTYGDTPFALLKACAAIEAELGRTRTEKNAPRTADIDILLFGEVLVNESGLTVPHPRITGRRFCLLGLQEIAPEWRVPPASKTVRELAEEMANEVRKQKVRIIG